MGLTRYLTPALRIFVAHDIYQAQITSPFCASTAPTTPARCTTTPTPPRLARRRLGSPRRRRRRAQPADAGQGLAAGRLGRLRAARTLVVEHDFLVLRARRMGILPFKIRGSELHAHRQPALRRRLPHRRAGAAAGRALLRRRRHDHARLRAPTRSRPRSSAPRCRPLAGHAASASSRRAATSASLDTVELQFPDRQDLPRPAAGRGWARCSTTWARSSTAGI